MKKIAQFALLAALIIMNACAKTEEGRMCNDPSIFGNGNKSGDVNWEECTLGEPHNRSCPNVDVDMDCDGHLNSEEITQCDPSMAETAIADPDIYPGNDDPVGGGDTNCDGCDGVSGVTCNVQSTDGGNNCPTDYRACSGSVLTWCSNGQTRTFDCSVVGLTCQPGHGDQGTCVAPNATDGGHPTDGGTPHDAGGNICIDDHRDCVNSILVWCQNGEQRSFDCANVGLVCHPGYGNDGTCVSPTNPVDAGHGTPDSGTPQPQPGQIIPYDPPSTACTKFGRNIFVGGEFSNGDLVGNQPVCGWMFDHEENVQRGRLCSTPTNCTLHMKTRVPGAQPWVGQLVYPGLPVLSGKTYRLEYTLCSTIGQPGGSVVIQFVNDADWRVNGNAHVVVTVGGGQCVNGFHDFTMSRTENVRVGFAFGNNGVEWAIDHVRGVELPYP